jgi:hypothetical protein
MQREMLERELKAMDHRAEQMKRVQEEISRRRAEMEKRLQEIQEQEKKGPAPESQPPR